MHSVRQKMSMAGPFNNEPLFPPKPVASETSQTSTGNTQVGSKGKGGGGANQGGSGPNESGGNQGPGGGSGGSVFDSNLFCYTCNLRTTSLENMRDHINGQKHKQNAEKQKQNAASTQEANTADKPSPDSNKNESGGKGRGFEKNWYCEVCNVKTTCSENLEAHFKGQKHKSNLAKMGLQGNANMSESSFSAPPKKIDVSDEIIRNTHPLIGVECMTEYEHIEPVQEPHYECSVCQLLLMPGNVIPHLMGYKHRVKYVEVFRPDLYAQFIRPIADKHNLLKSTGEFNDDDKRGKGTLSGRARDLAAELEKRDGRRQMKTVVLRGQKVPTQLRMGQIHFSEIAKMGGMNDWSFKATDDGWRFSESVMKNWGGNEGPQQGRGGPMGMGHGPGPMGMGPDGPGPRGMGHDGPGPMGMGPDGPGPRGMGHDGPGPMGMRPDGPGPMGIRPDGPGPMGMGPDGPGPMGMRPGSPRMMGMGPDGPRPMGMRPDGPGNMGMRHDGPRPMGMGPDGPDHMRGHMGMGHDGPRPMGPEVGGPGWMGPREEGPGFHAQPFLNEADIRPEMLSDEFIMREYERRFGGKKKNSNQPPLPDGPPSKKPRPPPPPGNLPEAEADPSEKMQNLFNELSTSMIKNEEDASMALQVSNTLTQALLNYRLKSLPEGTSLLG